MNYKIEENKKNAIDFYDLMFNQCKPEEAINKYAGDVYIQHIPEVGDGKEAFVEYFKKMEKEYPGKKVYFKKSNCRRRICCASLLSDLARLK